MILSTVVWFIFVLKIVSVFIFHRDLFWVCEWYLLQIVLCYKINFSQTVDKTKIFNTENKPDYTVYTQKDLYVKQ